MTQITFDFQCKKCGMGWSARNGNFCNFALRNRCRDVGDLSPTLSPIGKAVKIGCSFRCCDSCLKLSLNSKATVQNMGRPTRVRDKPEDLPVSTDMQICISVRIRLRKLRLRMHSGCNHMPGRYVACPVHDILSGFGSISRFRRVIW